MAEIVINPTKIMVTVEIENTATGRKDSINIQPGGRASPDAGWQVTAAAKRKNPKVRVLPA